MTADPDPEDRSSLSEYRILLVEDDDDDVLLVRRALRRQQEFSFSLDRATTLDEGVDRCVRGHYDIVLLDLNLPGTRHLDTLGPVLHAAPRAAVIVVTGLDDRGTALQAVAAGAQDYMVKQDLNQHELCRSIRYAVERKRSRDLFEQLREDFLTHLTHEFRTPLTAAMAALELTQADPDGAEVPDLLGTVRNNLTLLHVLTGNLLDAAALASGELQVRPGRVPVGELVRSAVDAVAVRAATEGVRLELGAVAAGTVLADRFRIVQVLVNLLTNAVVATPPGGRVRVEAVDTGHGVRFHVDDTGPGAPPGVLAALVAGRSAGPRDISAASGGGLGLGLPVSGAIIRAHASGLDVGPSPLGRGTRLAFELPHPASGN